MKGPEFWKEDTFQVWGELANFTTVGGLLRAPEQVGFQLPTRARAGLAKP